MPCDWSLYPENWPEIAGEVKEEADWTCECCGKQCRRPGEPFDTHKRTLTVAHLDHDTANNDRETNLAAYCAPCHLRYDAPEKARKRKANAECQDLRNPLPL